MKLKVLNIFLLFWTVTTFAQDIHFSNFHTNVLNVNPALCGYYRGNYRISATVRDQYRSVAVPYQTASLGFDTKKNGFLKKNYDAGYGLLVNYDIAGDSHFSTLQINIPLAIHIRNYEKTSIFSFGIMPSIHTNSLEYTYLRFSEQFDGIKYDPSLPNGEDPNQTNRTFFNFSAGLAYNHKIDKKNSVSIGFSGNNLTKPDLSLYTNNKVKLPRRWTTHIAALLYINDETDIAPALKMQFQGPQQEYQFGALAIRYTHNLTLPRIYAGAWLRSKDKDAIILGLGCNYNSLDILFNYDINISTLSNVSNGRGAMELTLTYVIYEGNRKKKMKSVKCPSYL